MFWLHSELYAVFCAAGVGCQKLCGNLSNVTAVYLHILVCIGSAIPISLAMSKAGLTLPCASVVEPLLHAVPVFEDIFLT